ncbi:unnamed protein product [Sphenostylis stenocarpa]|uniref:Uncharacterized protein n=1 Tax=Sphenostylis stenocarpa TaxID=92480 RepID=A0AA86VEX0_9FABA|nr:unnamed protein product [Sphenostylis stenocarpa]
MQNKFHFKGIREVVIGACVFGTVHVCEWIKGYSHGVGVRRRTVPSMYDDAGEGEGSQQQQKRYLHSLAFQFIQFKYQ